LKGVTFRNTALILLAHGMKSDSRELGNDQLYQHLGAMVENMPPFPESVHQVMAMSSDINCSPKDMVRVIEIDPVLTMKILKMVNSAFFALSRHVASVQHALVYLGMNTIKNLAVAIATVDALPRASIPELSMSDFLTHSLATAAVAQRLAKENLHIRDASDHFVAGLLHDFGKAVFIQFEPTTYSKVLQQAQRSGCSLAETELEIMGVSSAEVGGMLAESWKLPPELVDCIQMHACADAQSSNLVLSVGAANTVVKAMKLGACGNPVVGEFPDFMCRRLDADLATVISQMHDVPSEIMMIQSTVKGP